MRLESATLINENDNDKSVTSHIPEAPHDQFREGIFPEVPLLVWERGGYD